MKYVNRVINLRPDQDEYVSKNILNFSEVIREYVDEMMEYTEENKNVDSIDIKNKDEEFEKELKKYQDDFLHDFDRSD